VRWTATLRCTEGLDDLTPAPHPPTPLRLLDNTYKAAFGDDGWGARNSDALLTVRGKDFRHEKTKKKRGNGYKGLIEMNAVKSIKLGEE
jgi:hypothetical protein